MHSAVKPTHVSVDYNERDETSTDIIQGSTFEAALADLTEK